MKAKSRFLVVAALALAMVMAFGGLIFVSADASNANGWVAEAPEGANEWYGSNNPWPMVPTDKGDGFTEWCFNNNHIVANETPLDVSKPIVLTYSTRSNVAPDQGSWVMFALATSFDGATKMSPGIQEETNAQYRPFYYTHQMYDNCEGITGAGAPLTVDLDRYGMLTNKCGAAYDESATVTLEIYFGAEANEDGYILVDGLYVGYPNVAQSAYADCTAYLAISSWHSGFVKIKVENKDTVTDIKDYSISASVQNAQVVLQDNALWRADAEEKVSFTVENIAQGYQVATVKAGTEVLTADQDGVYSFTMPASDTVIEVVTESKPDTYAVKYEGTSAVVKFDNGTGIYSAGDTVSFTVEVKDAYSLDEVAADGEVLKATDGVYTFEMPNKDVVLTIKATKQYSAPSDQTIANAVNSWNTEAVLDDPAYGPIVDGNGSSMVNEGEGYSNFALNNGGSISSVIGFDVTKPIYLDILIKPNGPIPGTMGWFMIGMYDDWNIMLEAGVNGYGNSGTSLDLNEKINEYLKACIGFGYNDINSTELPMGVWKGLVLEENFSLTNKFGDAWEWSDDDRKTDFDYAKFEFYIGATAEEGYIKIDGVKVATPQVAQADFHDGTAYFHLMSFYSSRVQAKIYSQSELDATTAFDERNESWKKEYAELKNLLSAEDYEQARSSTLNAYYTAKDVIGGIYAALERFGVKGNNRILEPAMGTGNFFGYMPKEIAEGSRLYGVELDNITGRIAAKLYPQANIQIKGFEDTSFPNDKFDIVVGNVPFGGYGVADSDYNRYNFKVHDYFLESFDTPEMKSLLERKLEHRTEWKNVGKGEAGLTQMDDRELLEKAFSAKNGDTVRRLYNGEDLRHNHSNSDMSLMNYLAFYSGGNVEQMTRIFATSGLYRPDKPASYYEYTAIKAAKDTPHYTPPKASNAAPKAASGGNSKA